MATMTVFTSYSHFYQCNHRKHLIQKYGLEPQSCLFFSPRAISWANSSLSLAFPAQSSHFLRPRDVFSPELLFLSAYNHFQPEAAFLQHFQPKASFPWHISPKLLFLQAWSHFNPELSFLLNSFSFKRLQFVFLVTKFKALFQV